MATAAPSLQSSPPPLVVDAPAELLSAAATSDVAQSAAERVVNAAPTAAEVLQAAAAEPTLAELGLAHYTPVGLIQNLLEFMHVDLGLPWWGAIVIGKCNSNELRITIFHMGRNLTHPFSHIKLFPFYPHFVNCHYLVLV